MRKLNVIGAVLGLGLGLVAAAPAANAQSLNFIPQQEGEVLTNLGYLDANATTNIDTSGLGFSVTSLEYGDDNGPSRLFVDKVGSENDWGFGIKFDAFDKGTHHLDGSYMFRSVAYDNNGDPLEGGELEIGRFLFNLDRVYETITLDLMDVETSGFSGVLKVNGESVEDMLLAEGANNEVQTLTLKNVSSFEIQLGDPDKVWQNGSQGDGVNLAGVQSVPEPTTTLSLGALAVAGMFGVKKRKNIKKSAI
ncbi:MAG: LEVG family PEP-CTERM protein [Rivularia sp. (in: cyanobacteria)]|jgi:hypothetical protein